MELKVHRPTCDPGCPHRSRKKVWLCSGFSTRFGIKNIGTKQPSGVATGVAQNAADSDARTAPGQVSFTPLRWRRPGLARTTGRPEMDDVGSLPLIPRRRNAHGVQGLELHETEIHRPAELLDPLDHRYRNYRSYSALGRGPQSPARSG